MENAPSASAQGLNKVGINQLLPIKIKMAIKNKAMIWIFLWFLNPVNKLNPAINTDIPKERCSKNSFSKNATPVRGATRIIIGNAIQ